MKEGTKLMLSVLSGIVVGKTADAVLSNGGRGIIFGAGRILTDLAIGVSACGFAYTAIDVASKKISDVAGVIVEEAKKAFDQQNSDNVTIVDDVVEEDDEHDDGSEEE